MNSLGENVVVCPHCGYNMLFPPAETVWNCPVCGGIIKKGEM